MQPSFREWSLSSASKLVCSIVTTSFRKGRILWNRKQQSWVPQERMRVLFSDESKCSKQTITWRENGARFHILPTEQK
ncbi:hypothetical protein TNCV_3162461 [Trichonephila clavipes]|nr:hypothetical protein TNCV_3162461 [Trichonephila clavipes]